MIDPSEYAVGVLRVWNVPDHPDRFASFYYFGKMLDIQTTLQGWMDYWRDRNERCEARYAPLMNVVGNTSELGMLLFEPPGYLTLLIGGWSFSPEQK